MYHFCPCKKTHYPPIQSSCVLNDPVHNCKKLSSIDPIVKCNKASSRVFKQRKLIKLSRQSADLNFSSSFTEESIAEKTKIKIAIDITPNFTIDSPSQSKLGYREKFALRFMFDKDLEVSEITSGQSPKNKTEI